MESLIYGVQIFLPFALLLTVAAKNTKLIMYFRDLVTPLVSAQRSISLFRFPLYVHVGVAIGSILSIPTVIVLVFAAQGPDPTLAHLRLGIATVIGMVFAQVAGVFFAGRAMKSII